MPRLYLPAIQPEKNLISITGEKAHYLVSVLRCQKGDELILFDGEGNCFRSAVTKSGRREVTAEVLGRFTCDLESPLKIVLMQSLLKGEKMDMVVRRTAELGVAEIIPVITTRSQVKETKKVQRWRKIAEEASKQSGRSIIPLVHEPVVFTKVFSESTLNYSPLSPVDKEGRKGSGIIFYEEGGVSLSEAASSFIPHPSFLHICIGPEGGFTREEVVFSEEKGMIIVSLGKRILRAETAAIASVAMVQFLLGDMG